MSTKFLIIKNTDISGTTSNEFVDAAQGLSGGTLNLENLTISGKTVGDSVFKTWAQWYRNDNTIYTTTPVSTSIKIGSQFTGDTFSPNSKGFTYSAGTLTFNGSETEQQFHLTISMTAEASANNQLYDFWVAVNGTQLDNIVIANELGTKKESISLTGIVPLNPGDYMELYTRNNTANKNILFSSINFSSIQI